jgi:hypothetical protein
VDRASIRPIGAVDTIWLNMDRPNNLMIIDSVMLFDEPVDWDRLTLMLRRRLVDRFPVFRQRPVDPAHPLGLPHWEDDPRFALGRHVRRVRLPEPGDDAVLQRYIEQQIHRPFNRRHPLWEYHLIDGYGPGAAVLARFHHALADGAALMEVLLSTTDATPDGDLAPDPEDHPRIRHVSPRGHAEDENENENESAQPDEPLDGLAGLLGAAARMANSAARSATAAARSATAAAHSATAAASAATAAASAAARTTLHLLEELPHVATHAAALVDVLALTQQTGQVAGKLLLAGNPVSPLTGTPVPAKRVVWSSPRPLADVKHAGRPAGATVNDVILTAVSAALARYVADRGGDPVDLVTMIPVNLRKPGEPLPRELGNKFALVFLELPSGEHPPLARLALAKQRMDQIKHSPEAVLTFGLIQAIGRTNPDIERLLVDFFSNKAFGVTTNVIGPAEQRWMAGTPLAGVLGWVPGSGRHSLGVCVLTYNRTLRAGFKADAAVVPDPERLVTAFDECLEDLLYLATAHGSHARRANGTQPATL